MAAFQMPVASGGAKLLKTITTPTFTGPTDANINAGYTGTLWNANEISSGYDALLITAEVTPNATAKLYISDGSTYGYVYASNSSPYLRAFFPHNTSSDGYVSVSTSSTFVPVSKAATYEMWVLNDTTWSGTATIKIYGINFV